MSCLFLLHQTPFSKMAWFSLKPLGEIKPSLLLIRLAYIHDQYIVLKAIFACIVGKLFHMVSYLIMKAVYFFKVVDPYVKGTRRHNLLLFSNSPSCFTFYLYNKTETIPWSVNHPTEKAKLACTPPETIGWDPGKASADRIPPKIKDPVVGQRPPGWAK